MGKELKIGIFTTVVILIAVWFIVTISNYRIKRKSYSLNIDFTYIGGLDQGAPVRLSGVKVGEVKRIFVYNNFPRVVCEIQKGIYISKTAKVYINTLGIIGESYVEIINDRESEDYYADDNIEIPFKGLDAVSMGDLIVNLNDFSLKLGRFETSISLINKTLSNLDSKIDVAFEKFDKLTGPIDSMTKEFDSFMEIGQNSFKKINQLLDVEKIKKEAGKLKELVENTNKFISSMNLTIENINEGTGTLGKMISDDKLYTEIRDISKEFKEVVQRSREIEFWWHGDLISNRIFSEFEGSLHLDLYTRKNKFYTIGITRIGTVDPMLNAKLNIIYNKVLFSAGIYEESPALGIGYYFSKNGYLLLDSYRWTMGIDDLNIKLTFKYFFGFTGLNLTLDNILYSPAVKLGLTLRFKEDDLKYLLGVIK